jgi:hypothetical protein
LALSIDSWLTRRSRHGAGSDELGHRELLERAQRELLDYCLKKWAPRTS